MPTVIWLEDGKHLNVKDDISFPIERALSDIRDISSRRGSFSRELTLVGDNNNIKTLGYLFDSNVVDSDFDINKKLECYVEQNGAQVFKGYFQLRKVITKSTSHTTDEDTVEFQGLVFDYTADFFSSIKKRNVDELKVSEPDDWHTLNYTNIVASWSHTASDKYCYPVYYKPQYYANGQYLNATVYKVRDFKPAIFAKSIWDSIHDEAGFTYEWNTLTASDVQFDKVITPFNSSYEASQQEIVENSIDIGTELNPDPDDSSPHVESFSAFSYGQYWGYNGNGEALALTATSSATLRPNPNPPPATPITINSSSGVNAAMKLITNVNRDDNSQYNTSNGFFTPTLQGEHDVYFDIDYKIIINAPSAGKVNIFEAGTYPENRAQIGFRPFVRKYPLTASGGLYTYYEGAGAVILEEFADETALSSGNNEYTGTYNGSLVVDLSPDNGEYLDLFGTNCELGVYSPNYNYPQNVTVWYFIDGSGNTMNCEISLEITSINIRVEPRITYQQGLNIDIDRFLPKNYKQIDFVKDVMTMYNLMAIPDEDDPNNIIYKKRDDFYDEGAQKDFKKYLMQDRDKTIEFLPDLQSKFLMLGYSPDDDRFNEDYQKTTGRTFGSMLIEFESEFTEGTEERLLTASPTPTGKMLGFGGYAPHIDVNEPAMNPRFLYFIGSISNDWITIQERDGTFINPGAYGAAHHADDFINPSFDLNFGVCERYFYPDMNPTINNLFNLHYRRLINSINTNKLMTAYFALPEIEVSNLKLNDRIYVDNCWWYINKFTFDATRPKFCRMELIQIDNEQSIKPVRGSYNNPTKPFPDSWGSNSTGTGTQDDNYGTITETRNKSGDSDSNRSYNIYGGQNENYNIKGENNVLQNGVRNVQVIGDRNNIRTSGAMVVGSGLTTTKAGIHAENIYVYKDIVYPAESGKVSDKLRKYVKVIDRSEIITLNSSPITISRGDLELEGVTTPLYIRWVETTVEDDGTNFTGGVRVLIDQDSGTNEVLVNSLSASVRLVSDGINTRRECNDSNDITITSDSDPGGGGTDSFIKFVIYYSLLEEDLDESTTISS